MSVSCYWNIHTLKGWSFTLEFGLYRDSEEFRNNDHGSKKDGHWSQEPREKVWGALPAIGHFLPYRCCPDVMANRGCQLDTLESTPSSLPMDMSLGQFLIANWHRRVQASMGICIPRLMGLGNVGKLEEYEQGDKPVSSFPCNFCFILALHVSVWLPIRTDYDPEVKAEVNPFLPQLSFGQVVYHSHIKAN